MNAPELSILIVAHNSSAVLPACLASVAAETTLAHEIIIVDNASVDGTASLVRTCFPQVTLIENRVNAGFAAATNAASRLAQGRYLLLLNPDTVMHREALDRLVHFMDAQPEIGIVAPRVVDEAGKMAANTQRFHTPGTLFWRTLCSGPLAALARRKWAQLDAQDQRGYAVFGCALLIRSDLYRALGGLDERFFLYEEDIDLCYRATQAGWGVTQVAEVFVTHYGGKSSNLPDDQPAQARLAAAQQRLRSRSLYATKHFTPAASLMLHLSYALIGVGLWSLGSAHRDRTVRRRRCAMGAEYVRVGLGGLR
jgi:GT2 family glycosyltransferase